MHIVWEYIVLFFILVVLAGLSKEHTNPTLVYMSLNSPTYLG
jgi:hypothetical protein